MTAQPTVANVTFKFSICGRMLSCNSLTVQKDFSSESLEAHHCEAS